MAKTLFLCFVLIFLWASHAGCMSVFHSPPQAHMLLRSRRANSFLEELKPASLERECIEERCDFEEAREIYQTREATLTFWTVYTDGNQCIPNACENGVCVDQFQKYICICNPGYEGKRCQLVNSHTNCSVDNGGCDHNCHEIKDKLGRYCSCINGYMLQEDSKQCVPKSQQSCGQILIPKSIYRSKPIVGLQPWIMGGEVGKRGESPWQALILNSKGKFHCGGVLLDEVWVLTAAHCLEGFSLFSVRLGDYKRFEIEGSEVTLSVVKTIPHPKYSRLTMDNDIALLRLKLPVTFNTYIVPACLPSQDLAERVLHLNGTMTVVTGWGKEKEGTIPYSSDLKHINVPLMDQSECAHHMVNNLTENVLCAGRIGSIEDACKGDSGGPMMTLYRNTWFLVGLVSWGEGCGRTDKLGIYTKVSNYLEWIDSISCEKETKTGFLGFCSDLLSMTMGRAIFLCFSLIFLWASSTVCTSVFYSSPEAHMLLRSRRANSMLEELKAPSVERECMEERCDFEEAKEIYKTKEATLRFWSIYEDSTHTNCSVDNGDCDHDCYVRKDKLGRYCSCINGYALHEDFKQCVPKNQQSCGQILIAKSSYRSKPTEGLQPWLVGGEVGKRGESPWQALILNSRGKFQCGGVLIDAVWVLTAAHCLEGFNRFAVRLGDYKRFEFEGSEVTIRVVKTVPHPKYNSLRADNDIALLRLESPVTFSMYIVPACLPSQDMAERVLHLNGTITVVTGWGTDKEGTIPYSSDLKHIKVPLMEQSDCAHHMVNNLTENVLCAGTIGSIKDACSGDSGGPMMTLYRNTWFLIGLVSWGEGCGHTDKLGIYTKVSNYMEWINIVKKQP